MWTRLVLLAATVAACAVLAGPAEAAVDGRLTGLMVTRDRDSVAVTVAVRVGEAVDFVAKVKRAGHLLGKRSRHVKAGQRQIDVLLANKTAAGRVKVVVKLGNRAGERRTIVRSADVPAAP